ncbi:MAG: hypothetical protein K0R54_2581 [Clostridiaceae bacterium]|jgi:hypothetical protein|nr:hypothetical protein [Clostridiaceae bacterium]
MNKKIIMHIVIILIIILAIFYYRPIGVNNLIQPLSSKNLPLKIETAIFFSTQSGKELDVTNMESIEQIITLIESIKVRRNIITPQSYSPQFKETYRLVFNGKKNNNQYINILNSKYIQINHKQYEIIGTSNLSKLYDLIILDQAEGTLDKFYYDLISNK